jgi:hypothetical protein
MYFDGFSYKPSALPLFFLIILQAFSAESKACPPAPPLDAPSFSRISFDYLIIGKCSEYLILRNISLTERYKVAALRALH